MYVEIVHDNREKALAELDAAKRSILEEVGRRAERYAKAKAPVDTGRLRSSIRYKIDGDTVEIVSDVDYAKYQEFGTIYITGKHFMRDALAHHITEYIQLMRDALKA